VSGPFFWAQLLGSLLLVVLVVHVILPIIFISVTSESSIRNGWLFIVSIFLVAALALAGNVLVSIKLGRDLTLLLRGEIQNPDLREYLSQGQKSRQRKAGPVLGHRRLWAVCRTARKFLAVHRLAYAALAALASVLFFCLIYMIPASARVLHCWYSPGCRETGYSQLVAHRGGSAAAPDNSVMACAEAAEGGQTSMLMVDLQATADGRTVALSSPDLRDVLDAAQIAELYSETCDGTPPPPDGVLPAACTTPYDVLAQQLKVLRTCSTGRRYVRLDPRGFYHKYSHSLKGFANGEGIDELRAEAENETAAALSDVIFTTINHSKQLLLNLLDRGGPLPPPPVTNGPEGQMRTWPLRRQTPQKTRKVSRIDNEDYREYAVILANAVTRDLSDLGFLDSSKQSVVSFRVSSRQMFQELVCRTTVLTIVIPIQGYVDEWWTGLNCRTTSLMAKSIVVGVVVEPQELYLVPRVQSMAPSRLQVHFDRVDSPWTFILGASSGATHVYTSIPNSLDIKADRDSIYAPLCLAAYVLSVLAVLTLGAVWEVALYCLRKRVSSE